MPHSVARESIDVSLSRRLIFAMVVPGVLLVAAGMLLLWQLTRLTDTAHWVDHTDQVIAKIYELQAEVVDQETSLRGFLLSEDRAFLERYLTSTPASSLRELAQLVADNRVQVDRVNRAQHLYERWNELAQKAVAPAANVPEFRGAGPLRERKLVSDALRGTLSEMLKVEAQLRQDRSAKAEANSGAMFIALLALVLLLASVIAFVSRRQVAAVGDTYANALESELKQRERLEAESWARTAQLKLSDTVQGDMSIERLATKALEQLVQQMEADVAAAYVADPEGFRLVGGYALAPGAPERFGASQGLVGRAATEQKLLRVKDVPGDYLRIESGIGARHPIEVVLLPAATDGVVHAVLEFGFLRGASQRNLDLLDRVGDMLATRVRSVGERKRLRELLEESQTQAEELQAQQEELRVANEELAQQGDALRDTQAQLEERQEQLQASNSSLTAQRDALEQLQRNLKDKALELERASQYKSEFLANMSHELRTPLNSTLILAKLLADNKLGNLTKEQVNFASSIYAAGNDLLALINDILDLSKIEAGKVDVDIVGTTLGKLVEPVTKLFQPVAAQRGLEFVVELEAPDTAVDTDVPKAQQVLKNLLSNAFKFTEQGSVRLIIGRKDGQFTFACKDTGIGIPAHQHAVIFEAFRQADGTTNRRFGGTGLGLSISRDLARLLGGDLYVESTVGHGSKFTFSLPVHMQQPKATSPGTESAPAQHRALPRYRSPAARSGDGLNGGDRLNGGDGLNGSGGDGSNGGEPITETLRALDPSRRLLLIVEDDSRFAEIVARTADELEFSTVIAHNATQAVRLALAHPPAAIVLDINLPDHSGLTVLDRLKREPTLRHIPVHVMSAEDHTQAALTMGAAGYLVKPVKQEDIISALRALQERFSRVRRLLVVEDDPIERDAICRLLESSEVEIVAVPGVQEALEKLRSTTFDCVVTDLVLSDGTGYELLEKMASDDAYSFPPVIVYTGRSLTAEEEQRLRRHSSAIIVKGVRSPERLLDEVTLFLHQVESKLPPDRQRMLQSARDREAAFEGRKILLAEDDVRNVFAMTSVFEPKGAKLVIARNGREALEALDREPDIDLVLMDIMMPEIDGLEAMRQIRARGGKYTRLPIIALTAKAMRDDQERCLNAGANDYIAKPLDVDMLLSLSRVWMAR
jgi:CheY-like chemotaxis protein/signal transduction histidine kinase/CHASE3 domain sensor protein